MLDLDLKLDVEKKVVPAVKTVTPNPGFCVKTKEAKGGKVFLNLCHSDSLPAPRDIGEEELMAILESESPSDYKVPLSLGEPRAADDKSGKPSTIYDVVVNSDFFASKMVPSELFKTFVITAALEGLEDKHGSTLDKNAWTILRNKKYFGELQLVTVHDRKKPLIVEVPRAEVTDALDEERPIFKAAVPSFTLSRKVLVEKSGSVGEKLACVARVYLPKVKSSNDLKVSVGEDRVTLHTIRCLYHLDIFLPLTVDDQNSTAEFNLQTKMLAVNMPVIDTKGHLDH